MAIAVSGLVFGPGNGKIMLIIFNFIGAGMLILAVVIGGLVAYLFGTKAELPSVVLTGLVAGALDVLYRRKAGGGSLFHPRRGGHISFIPVWIIGLGIIGMGCLGFSLDKKLLGKRLFIGFFHDFSKLKHHFNAQT